MKTTEIPFPEVLPNSEETSLEDGADVFEGSATLRICYDLSLGSQGFPEIVAKAPGGKDAKKNRKEKPKGHTDTSTKRK
jgi:hypothetical protein